MNLSDIMKDLSLTNLTWLSEPETYIPKSKDINKKDDLAIQWSSDWNFDDKVVMPVTTIQDEMTLRGNVLDQIINSASILMHEGLSEKEVVKQLLTHFIPEDIMKAKEPLEKLFSNQGMIGFFVIDLKNIQAKEDIYKAWKRSKYSKVAKYVMMSASDLENSTDISVIKTRVNLNEVASIDNFLNEPEAQYKTDIIHNLFELPVIFSFEDLDESEYEDTLVDLINLSCISEDEAKELKAKGYKGASELFNLLKSRENVKIVAEDKSSEYKISVADNEIEFIKEADNKSLDVNPYVADGELELAEEKKDIEVDPYIVPESEFKGCDEFELNKKAEEQKELEINPFGEFNF